MLDGLYCEYLKLRRTGYYTGILLIALICLFFSTLNKGLVGSLNWYGYFSKFEFASFTIVYTIIIPNIIALIFVREFLCKTVSIEFSYPKGRMGAFVNKFIIAILIIAAIYAIGYASVVISGLFLLKTPITVEPLMNHLKVFLTSFAFQVALMPLTIIAALLGRSMVISFAYSMVLIAGNVNYLLGVKYKDFIFSILPAAPVAKLSTPVCTVPIPVNLVITRSDIYMGITVFLLGIIACLVFYRKADIY